MAKNRIDLDLTLEQFKEHPELAYKMVFRAVYGIIKNREDAEDVTQDALLKAWQKAESFKGESKFSTWIITVASNHALIHLRKQKTRKEQVNHCAMSLDEPINPHNSNSVTYDVTDPGQSVLELLIADEKVQKVKAAIAQLPEKQRAIVSRRMEGMRNSRNLGDS